ncbi:MAG TPA: glycerophosphodiester phosphodiesterase [Acidimicrobiales bacterium]|jgi:glycerophosphoryl diester phosphodiesterase
MEPVRVPPLRRPPIGFAHRGARAHARENTLEAFSLALRLGATGLESDVWLTSDGVPVLDHDGFVRVRLRRRRIGDLTVGQLPDHIPTLAALFDEVGADVDLSLDVKDPAAAAPTVAAAGEAGTAALGHLWLCHPDWRVVAGWRRLSPDVRLVDSTRLRRIKEGPERRASTLSDLGVDAMNLHWTDWSAGLVTLLHRFKRYAFAWDVQFDHHLDAALEMGLDAVYSDHSDRLAAALARGR